MKPGHKVNMKLIIGILTFTVLCCDMSASPIVARQKVQDFLNAITKQQEKNAPKVTLAYSIPAKDKVEASLYIFNIGDGNGFVVASGTNIGKKVLAYVGHGSFHSDDIPCNFKEWLDDCARLARTSNVQEKETDAPFAASVRRAMESIDPLIQSKWNQYEPYNDQCVFNGARCLTGCVPTAMAQIMYYWATTGKDGRKWHCGSKAISGYTTGSGYQVPDLPALESFEWDNMTNDEPTTPESKNAVATLMRYCGQSLNANYGTSSTPTSSSRIDDGLVDFFGYNFTCANMLKKLTTQQWTDLLYEQLSEGKPVVISGSGPDNEGHAFICDGYDSNTNMFHFNWGWGGFCDGWYAIDTLNPDGYDFSTYKSAIINIQPLEPSAYALFSSDGKTMTLYYDTERDSRSEKTFLLRHAYGGIHTPWVGPFFTGTEPDQVTMVVFDSSMADARPSSTQRWFYFMENLTKIDGIKHLNTSETTDMTEMFSCCRVITDIDLSFLNTSNVTIMDGLFSQCNALQRIRLDNFDTHQVTSMSGMFSGCYALKEIDLSHFNTEKVTNMGGMFENCGSLKSIDVSPLNTSEVTDFNRMFMGCDLLAAINVSHFDTRKAEETTAMFFYCYQLKDISISSTMSNLDDVFYKVGTASDPCRITAPADFDFGVDTDKPYFIWKDGYFRLASYSDINDVKIGDVNGDGKVNGTDIQAVINVIVDEDYVEKADINKDGKVNGTDIQEIINIIVEEE